MRRRMLAAGRVAIAVPLMLAVAASATGWLYTIGPHAALPGPRVGDGLPLDELSKRASVPLLAFVGVWALAALLLGLLARFARTERLTAALLLALGVGAWGYLATGVSILVIRQIPADAAFHSASRLHAVYIAAALAGLGGALLGRVRVGSRSRWPLLLAAFVAVAGALDVLDAILPVHRTSLLERLAPDAVHPLANALAAPIGVVLMLLGARARAAQATRVADRGRAAARLDDAAHLPRHGLRRDRDRAARDRARRPPAGLLGRTAIRPRSRGCCFEPASSSSGSTPTEPPRSG